MSWLNVRGKRFCCERCGRRITIEYKGGPRPTQVSDVVIHQQFRRSMDWSDWLVVLLPRPLKDWVWIWKVRTWNKRFQAADGIYLEEDGLCERCFRARAKADLGQQQTLEHILNLAKEVTCLKGECKAAVDQLVTSTIRSNLEQWTLADFSALDERVWKETLGVWNFDQLGNRRRRAACRRFATMAIQAMEAKCRQWITGRAEIREAIRECNERLQPLLKEAEDLLPSCPKEGFLPKRTDAPENLNPFIVGPQTIREPEPGSVSELFYIPVTINHSELRSIFSPLSLDGLKFSEHNLQRLVRRRLESLVGCFERNGTQDSHDEWVSLLEW